jgi:hypothetical protein
MAWLTLLLQLLLRRLAVPRLNQVAAVAPWHHQQQQEEEEEEQEQEQDKQQEQLLRLWPHQPQWPRQQWTPPERPQKKKKWPPRPCPVLPSPCRRKPSARGRLGFGAKRPEADSRGRQAVEPHHRLRRRLRWLLRYW